MCNHIKTSQFVIFLSKIQISSFHPCMNHINHSSRSLIPFSYSQNIFICLFIIISFINFLPFHSNITDFQLVLTPSLFSFLLYHTFILFIPYHHINFLGSFSHFLIFYLSKLVTGFVVVMNF
jgi:hypothetical protein